MISVARISVTPVKCFRLNHPDEVVLGADGVAGNRLFFLVSSEGERLRSSRTPWPVVVSADYDRGAEMLTMTFPGGVEVSASAVATGDALECEIGKRPQSYRLVPGPWDELLSELGGHGVRLGRIEQVGATMVEPLTIMSSASVERVAREAGLESLDSRRFRSLFELDGCREHEEDEWQGRRLRAGEALIEVGEPVIRCAVTTRDPSTGQRDLDTLELIAGYRGQGEDGEIFFARYGRVVEPGLVRVGDEVEVV